MPSCPKLIARTLLASMLAWTVGQLGGHSIVQASCVAPELQLLWSYPEHGAEQVPTHVVIWAVTNTWGARPAVTLDGAPVEPQGAPTFTGIHLPAQELSANSEHTLVLDYSGSPNPLTPDAQPRFEIKFKTGGGRAEAQVPEVNVTGSTRVVTDFLQHDCAEVIAAQDCFDTGQNALLTLELEETQPDETVGWLLRTGYHGSSAIWPARCGSPSVYIHEQESLCHQVQRIGVGGRLSKGVEYCSKPSAQPSAPGPADGGQAAIDRVGAASADASVTATRSSAEAGSTGTRASAQAAADAPTADAGCSTVSGARTAARAFWAIVAIALLLAHHQRRQRKRPPACTPSRRFRL